MSLQIEREKADLSVQVIQLVERLEEAEGGAESQVSVAILHHLSSKTRKQHCMKLGTDLQMMHSNADL
jgi:hypothetical protein